MLVTEVTCSTIIITFDKVSYYGYHRHYRNLMQLSESLVLLLLQCDLKDK